MTVQPSSRSNSNHNIFITCITVEIAFDKVARVLINDQFCRFGLVNKVWQEDEGGFAVKYIETGEEVLVRSCETPIENSTDISRAADTNSNGWTFYCALTQKRRLWIRTSIDGGVKTIQVFHHPPSRRDVVFLEKSFQIDKDIDSHTIRNLDGLFGMHIL
jgi:hypothetical protein